MIRFPVAVRRSFLVGAAAFAACGFIEGRWQAEPGDWMHFSVVCGM
jgi:hypothetical protein